MKASLQLKMGQQLTMTPQLQQAIRLLQLSTLDLQTEIQQAVDSNPLLEYDESAAMDQADGDEGLANQNSNENKENHSKDGESSADTDADLHNKQDFDGDTSASEEGFQTETIPEDLAVDSTWDDTFSNTPSSSNYGDDDNDQFLQGKTSEGLHEHLLWQMNLTPFSETDKAIAVAIIDAIDDSGFLTCTIEDIYEGLVEEDEEIELDEVQAVLHRIQHFDPAGVAARDLSECLILQLRQLPKETPLLDKAQLLLQKYSNLLSSRDFKSIMRKMRLDEHQLKHIMNLIQTLSPRPGSAIQQEESEYVVPDVSVTKINGVWTVDLNDENIPRLRINDSYASLIRNVRNSADNSYLKNQLQEAKWFLKSISSRNDTLLRVARCIVEKQQGFLDFGPEAMRPLVLHDIAELVDMHESTISRVTTQKYMHTPRGIFELKYFFSSHVSTESGGECSSTAIRALIKKLVAAENPSKPLSDSKIASVLAEQGIKVARRTIAKYREAMFIPPSNERKCL